MASLRPIALLSALLALGAPFAMAQSDAPPEVGAGLMNDLGEGVPVCTFIPRLNYPPALAEHRLGGDALVRVYVDETGRVYDTELVESALPELFIVEALKTARLSRFRPAERGGQGVRSSLTLLLSFPAAEAAPPAETPSARVETKPAPVEKPVATPVETPASTPPAQREEPVTETTPPVRESAPPAAPASSTLRVLDAGFGADVEDRVLRGRGSVFHEGDRVYFWMEVDGARPGQVLRHVWIYQGREVQEIPLSMKGERWISWSYKTLFAGLAGSWLLEVRDENDHLLGSWSFHCE